MQDARVAFPTFVMLNSFQHPWPGARQSTRRQLFFTQRHKEEGWGRQALHSVNGASGRTVAKETALRSARHLCVFM
jgi:hypothetical protein